MEEGGGKQALGLNIQELQDVIVHVLYTTDALEMDDGHVKWTMGTRREDLVWYRPLD